MSAAPAGAAQAGAIPASRSASERVASIVAAAEAAAERIRRQAEEEAEEIVATARAQSERRQRDLVEEAEQRKTAAFSEALVIVADAEKTGDQMLAEAAEDAREMMAEARKTADEVRNEGFELAAHLRQMGDSLRLNADRLLRDVQRIHSQMVSRIERPLGASPRPRGGDGARARDQHSSPRDDGQRGSGRPATPFDAPSDPVDVPEFIPRR